VLGILSLPAAFAFGVPGIVLAVLALVFAVLGLRRVRAGRADNRGMAIAGLVTGILGLLLSIVMLIAFIFVFRTAGDCIEQYRSDNDFQQYQDCLDNSIN